jgi:hypothetical protein
MSRFLQLHEEGESSDHGTVKFAAYLLSIRLLFVHLKCEAEDPSVAANARDSPFVGKPRK